MPPIPAPGLFWEMPIKYLRWAFNEKPALAWAMVVGCSTPLVPFIAYPARRYLGDYSPTPLPYSYPIPKGPRKELKGYDDE